MVGKEYAHVQKAGVDWVEYWVAPYREMIYLLHGLYHGYRPIMVNLNGRTIRLVCQYGKS
jgi:hypothetical protein